MALPLYLCPAAPIRALILPVSQPHQMRIIFITGTDTGVGKTLLTALLLVHLRQRGTPAFALKPFCAGSRADAKLLHRLQGGELTLDDINPFFFPEPLAPLVAARKHRREISLKDVIAHITRITSCLPTPSVHHHPHAATLLIEGCGGLLVPLGEGFTVLDLISRLSTSQPPCIKPPASSLPLTVIVVSRNKLGTINHTLLTLRALRDACSAPAHRSPVCHSPLSAPSLNSRHSPVKVLLMNPRARDASSASNPRLLSELLAPIPLLEIPFLEHQPCSPAAIHKNASRLKKVLRQL
jgi:dethiobiotin synthetase